MQITRRHLLATGATALAVPLLPRRTWATTSLNLGAVQIDTLSDGHLMLPGEFALGDMPPEQAAPVLAEFGLGTDSFEPPCNLTLLRDGTNTVLFDVGSGPNFMPTAGKVQDAFDALGVSPDDITHVVFTHAHPDHIWGLIDDFDEPVFYEATYMMGRAEWDYWWNPETVNTIGDARTTFAVGAKRRMEVIEDSVVLFDDGEEILPGIAAVASHGHTPGHMSFEIRNGSDAAMVIGDAIGNHHVAFRKPGWSSGSDQDYETAAATRMALFDRLVSEKMQLVGFHLPGGGMGRAEAADDGFRFIPGDA